MTVAARERDKYAKVWGVPAYSDHSPGAGWVDAFLEIVKPKRHASILDVGCGAGAASREFEKRGFPVTATDQVKPAGFPPHVFFRAGCIWHGLEGLESDHVYCCDVMEHIPTEFVALSLQNMLRACSSAFFSISYEPDHFGAFVGEPLHLTVKPFRWWLDVFGELGEVIEARDLMTEGLFHVRAIRS